ncbi:MAG UNVERIFIED_CONTAM: hypothetical protein LVR29_34715 [Microcystis novacekii LVE1205-3]|jgi:hypothetical protein
MTSRITLPPMERQATIVRLVNAELRRIGDALHLTENILIECGHLDQSLLATAFRGELVPQTPPTNHLSPLDRIRAARAQAGDTPRTHQPRSTSAVPPPARAAEPTVTYRTGDPYTTLLAALRQHGSLTSASAPNRHRPRRHRRPLLQRLITEGAAKIEGQNRHPLCI